MRLCFIRNVCVNGYLRRNNYYFHVVYDVLQLRLTFLKIVRISRERNDQVRLGNKRMRRVRGYCSNVHFILDLPDGTNAFSLSLNFIFNVFYGLIRTYRIELEEKFQGTRLPLSLLLPVQVARRNVSTPKTDFFPRITKLHNPIPIQVFTMSFTNVM